MPGLVVFLDNKKHLFMHHNMTMILRKLSTISVIFMSFLMLTNISKADEDKIKIAVVNVKKIENNSQISKDFLKKMSSKENEIQQQLLKRKNKLENDFKSLENKRSILSADELQKQARKLESDYQKFQMDGNFYSKTSELARMNALVIIQNNIKKAANIIANNKNRYDMIITTDTAIYLNSSKFDDITDETIKTMDKISKTIDYEDAYKRAKSEVEEMFKNAK